MFFVSCSYARNTNNQQGHHLAMKEMTILINIHQLDSIMNIYKDATPMVYDIRVYGILEKLPDEGNINECTKNLVRCL